tara:strand:- start:1464 stop:1652 length:189 start_codon:yes stop_codon:yes gene_type:complete
MNNMQLQDLFFNRQKIVNVARSFKQLEVDAVSPFNTEEERYLAVDKICKGNTIINQLEEILE